MLKRYVLHIYVLKLVQEFLSFTNNLSSKVIRWGENSGNMW